MNEAILKEVIVRLLTSPELQALLAAGTKTEEVRPRCLILVSCQDDVRGLPAIRERLGKNYTLEVCAQGSLEIDDSFTKRISCEMAMSGNWEHVYVSTCSLDQLAQIALGFSLDQTSKLVSYAITLGIPVEIGRVDWGFTEKTPPRYRQMFESYARKVAAFGVSIAGCEQRVAEAFSPKLVEPEKQLSSGLNFEKKLLSCKEALQVPSNSVLRIAKGTVLTPAAIDVLKKQKTEVYREGVRCL